MMSRLNRCKTISDFNCMANLGILVVICKHFNIFLSLSLPFSRILPNFVMENDTFRAYEA